MSGDPFHLNRPVHLACRDVFYEKFVAHLKEASVQPVPSQSHQSVEQALYFLRKAKCHAEAANLSEKTSSHSRRFVNFLTGMMESLESIVLLFGQYVRAEAVDNPIDVFLASGHAGADISRCHHQCATHLLAELLRVLQRAEQMVGDLRRTSVAKMALADKARYEKAYRHFMVWAESAYRPE